MYGHDPMMSATHEAPPMFQSDRQRILADVHDQLKAIDQQPLGTNAATAVAFSEMAEVLVIASVKLRELPEDEG